MEINIALAASYVGAKTLKVGDFVVRNRGGAKYRGVVRAVGGTITVEYDELGTEKYLASTFDRMCLRSDIGPSTREPNFLVAEKESHGGTKEKREYHPDSLNHGAALGTVMQRLYARLEHAIAGGHARNSVLADIQTEAEAAGYFKEFCAEFKMTAAMKKAFPDVRMRPVLTDTLGHMGKDVVIDLIRANRALREIAGLAALPSGISTKPMRLQVDLEFKNALHPYGVLYASSKLPRAVRVLARKDGMFVVSTRTLTGEVRTGRELIAWINMHVFTLGSQTEKSADVAFKSAQRNRDAHCDSVIQRLIDLGEQALRTKEINAESLSEYTVATQKTVADAQKKADAAIKVAEQNLAAAERKLENLLKRYAESKERDRQQREIEIQIAQLRAIPAAERARVQSVVDSIAVLERFMTRTENAWTRIFERIEKTIKYANFPQPSTPSLVAKLNTSDKEISKLLESSERAQGELEREARKHGIVIVAQPDVGNKKRRFKVVLDARSEDARKKSKKKLQDGHITHTAEPEFKPTASPTGTKLPKIKVGVPKKAKPATVKKPPVIAKKPVVKKPVSVKRPIVVGKPKRESRISWDDED